VTGPSRPAPRYFGSDAAPPAQPDLSLSRCGHVVGQSRGFRVEHLKHVGWQPYRVRSTGAGTGQPRLLPYDARLRILDFRRPCIFASGARLRGEWSWSDDSGRSSWVQLPLTLLRADGTRHRALYLG
jgi:hypothetical protein